MVLFYLSTTALDFSFVLDNPSSITRVNQRLSFMLCAMLEWRYAVGIFQSATPHSPRRKEERKDGLKTRASD